MSAAAGGGASLLRGDQHVFPVVHQQAAGHAAHRVPEERLHPGPTPRPSHRPVHHTHLEGRQVSRGVGRPAAAPTPVPGPAPARAAPAPWWRPGSRGSSAASAVGTAPPSRPLPPVPRTPGSRCRTDCPPAHSRQAEAAAGPRHTGVFTKSTEAFPV